MPVYELTSPKTNQTYQVEFDREPSHADIDEAAAHFDKQFWDANDVSPEIAEQGPVGTLAMSVPQTFAKTGTGIVGGFSRLLDKATDIAADLTGTQKGGMFGAIAEQTDNLQEEADRTYPTNPANPKSAVIGGGVAQGLSLLAGGAVGKAAGLGNAALATVPLVSAGMSGANEGIKKAEEIGVQSPGEQIAMGLLFGGVEVGTEKLFGLGNKAATDALLDAWKKPAAEMLTQAAKSVAGEGAEEVIAGSAQDLLTRAFAMEDPKNPGFTTTGVELPKMDRKMLERRGLEALGGAAGGTIFAGAQGVTNYLAPTAPQPVEGQALTHRFTLRNGQTRDVEFDQEPGPQDLLDVQNHLEATFSYDGVSEGQTDAAAVPGAAAGTADQTAAAGGAAAADGEVNQRLRWKALQSPESATPGLDEHVSDLTAEDVADLEPSEAEGPNLYAGKTLPKSGGLSDALAAASGQLQRMQQPAQVSESAGELLNAAHAAATVGSSTPWVPIKAVYEQALRLQPGLKMQDFLRMVQEGDGQQQVYLEPANTTQVLEAAEGFVVPSQSGPAVNMMMVPQGQQNLFAGAGGPGLSAGLIPGKLPGDVNTPTDFTANEAAARVQRLEASLRAGGQLSAGQKLLPAAAGNLSERAAAQIEFGKALAGLSGRRVVAVDGLKADDIGGVTNPGMKDTVFVNAASPRALQVIAGHELMHHLELAHPDLYQRLDDVLRPELMDMPKARQQYAAYKGDDVRREVYADLLGESLQDPQFWDRLAKREPGIFMPLARAVLGWFKDAIAALKARGWSASPYFKDLAKAQDVLAGALVEFVRREQGLTPQDAQAAVREMLTRKDDFMQGKTGNETRARFASPNAADRVIDGPRTDEQVSAEAKAWLESMTPDAAVTLFERKLVNLPADAMEHAAGQLIAQLSGLAANAKTEVQRVWAHVQAQKMARVWTREYLSADPARAMRARAVVNSTVLGPIAPVLAAQEVLAEKAQKVIDARFDGGAEGAARKLSGLGDSAGAKAGDTLAAQLSAERMLQEISATWQRLMQELQQAKSAGGAAVRGVKARLAGMRDAARARLAAKQGGRDAFADAPVRDSDEAIIGASVMADGIVDYERWKSAVQRDLGAQGPETLLGIYGEAMKVYHRELAAANRVARGKAAETDEEADSGETDDEVQMRAENRASRIIYQTEERLRQGSKDLQSKAPGGDTINRAFREQVTSPMKAEAFAARLEKLNVGGEVAARLFQTAAREATDQQAMRDYRADAARERRAVQQASQLIYRTEERLRQGSKDLAAGATGDSINRAFREQLKNPLSYDAFRKRLQALGVPPEVSGPLYRTALREAEDRAKMVQFKGEQAARELAKNQPALAKMLNQLRGKMYPGMKWQDVFAELPSSQKERQREIYKRLMQDERLRNLTAQDRLALTNELDKAWQRERRKVFKRELQKAGLLGEKKISDKQKVEAAAPRLLRLMNLGMMNSEMFREALAKEYGVKVIDAAKAVELTSLSERIQNAPQGLPRRKLEVQMMERLQEMTDSTLWQILESYWTASVLSGWRTAVSIGTAVFNGIEDVGLGSLKRAVETQNPKVFTDSVGALFKHLPSAFLEALDHIWTGNKTLVRQFERDAQQALEDGSRMTADVGTELWRKGGLAKAPGGFMIFYSRLLASLDHMTSTSTAAGMKRLALSRHPELYRKAMLISPADRAAAGKQARQELLGGRDPKTFQEGREIVARVRELLDAGIPTEIIAEAEYAGKDSALQNDPTGLVGELVKAVNYVIGSPTRAANAMEKRGDLDRLDRVVLHALRIVGLNGKVLSGTKFIRAVGNMVNRNLSYMPIVGLIRLPEEGIKKMGVARDVFIAKQVVGTLAAVGLLAYFRDDDDDEKGAEGGWQGLTPEEKSALMAQGKRPYSIWWRGRDGRIMSFSYQEWGIGGLLSVIGAMEDQRRYNGHNKADLSILVNGLTQGLMSWNDRVQMQGLPQLLLGTEAARNTDPGTGFANGLNKWAANTVGGFIPRVLKDADQVWHPELYDSREWWQKWVKEVPMMRTLSGGKKLDIFGQEIKIDRTPTSRIVQLGTVDPAYRLLGRLNERDIWLTDPSAGERVVKNNDGTRRKMNPLEMDRYQRLTGDAYRGYILKHGEELLRMDAEKARETIANATRMLRASAFYKAVNR